MKTIVIILGIVCAVSAIDVYPTKYDTIDIDAIIANKRLFDTYLACLLRKGKCNEEGVVLRDVIPDALITGCSKCNLHQRQSVEKVMRYLVKERNTDFQALVALYDPKGEYQTKYEHYLHDL